MGSTRRRVASGELASLGRLGVEDVSDSALGPGQVRVRAAGGSPFDASSFRRLDPVGFEVAARVVEGKAATLFALTRPTIVRSEWAIVLGAGGGSADLHPAVPSTDPLDCAAD